MEFEHKSVLLRESVAALRVQPGSIYVDCTAGGGGHTKAILDRLRGSGRVIAIDRDPDAVRYLREKFKFDPCVTVVQGNYLDVRQILAAQGIERVSGVLADLGVSSYQLDTAERGFSFHQDAPLDMRMSKSGRSAYDVVNECTEAELTRMIFAYGEEKFAKSIARRICAARAIKPVETTLELAEIVKSAIPARARREGGHPARRTFQAIRIEVNGELEMLPAAVDAMFSVLEVGGVLAVITFHSLEDRAVKTTFKKYSEGCTCPKDFPVCVCGKTPAGQILGKAVQPDQLELEENPRSRSARLRCIEKLKDQPKKLGY